MPASETAPRAGGAEWQTPAELAEYRRTPDYAETLRYLERLASAHRNRLRIENFGRTGEGRDLKVAICSADGRFDPVAIRASNRIVLLVQNAIHAGEMDGKDACLALLRDLLFDAGLVHLLDRVALVVIPVYNVDGHERRSPYNRINQNGPEEMGWRANGRNLNLNRDYLKAEAPETRAFLRLFRRWSPDFFVDNHVTDGADFQYDVTFGLDATPDVFPGTATWIRETLTPELERAVNASGHLALPGLVNLVDDTDPSQGFDFTYNAPRFSTGYMVLENRPGLLVELHMLKSYRERVTADEAILRALLAALHRDATALAELNRKADRAAGGLVQADGERGTVPLALDWDGTVSEVRFRGRRYERYRSSVSGAMAIRYYSDPWEATIPLRAGARVSAAATPPAGYIIPPPWTDVIDVLEVHGVELERTTSAWAGEVERYRCAGMQWSARPFEGRHPVLSAGNVESAMGRFGSCTMSVESLSFPAGSVVVPIRQRLARVAMHWLEPEAPDSALRWGFFASIFEQKETGEPYVVERLAADELARDPALREEFEQRVARDSSFAADPRARLDFFYDRSPWWGANRVGDYPVARLRSLEGLPLPSRGAQPAR